MSQSQSTAVSDHPTPRSRESTRCPECQGDVRPNGVESVCQDCGLVVDLDLVDHGPEWHAATVENPKKGDPRRTGAPVTVSRHDRGLHTTLGNHRDYQQLPAGKRRRITRLRIQHSRTVIATKRERNQVYAFTEVRRFASRLDLPERVLEEACRLVQDAHDTGLIQGRDLDGITAAAVYAAGRLSETTRSLTEVTDAARVDHSRIRMCFSVINQGLELALAPPQPREYLPRYASQLALPHAVERDARRLLAALDVQDVVGRNPCGVAAAALYTAARSTPHQVRQADAADVADVSRRTLRETRAILDEHGGDD